MLEDLYSREMYRIQSGQCSRVPKLNIVRDSWTRLNVQPSKVMQVNYTIGSNYKYMLVPRLVVSVA